MDQDEIRKQVNKCLQEVREIRKELDGLNQNSLVPGTPPYKEWLHKKLLLQSNMGEAISNYRKACKLLHRL